MKKGNQEITDTSIIEEILSCSVICHIAMTDDKGQPYLLPFNYGYRDGCIYIHSALSGRKIDILRKNRKVCFDIVQKAEVLKHEDACKWATLYRSVTGYGNVEIITDPERKREGLAIIMSHNGIKGDPEFGDRHVEAMVILKLHIEETTGKQSDNWDQVHNPDDLNLRSERLVLEEVSWSDLEDIHRLHSCAEVDEFNTLGLPESVEDTKGILRSWIQETLKNPRSSYTWKILLKETGLFIGIAGMHLSNDKFRLGEIYYKLLPEHWGRGYATETARLLIWTGLEDFNLHKVEAGVATGNNRSVRVLEKAGMKREGLRRKILPIRGNWVDNYHYAIVEDDLPYSRTRS